MSTEKEQLIICIDPGINMCGFSIAKGEGNKLHVLETHLVKNARKFNDEEKEVEVLHGTRYVKVMAIVNKLIELLDKHKTTKLVIEAPFYSALTPVAFGSLLEVILAIKYTVAIERGLSLSMVEPTLVKKIFTGHGRAKKEMMKEYAINLKLNGVLITKVDMESISEHEIDAIAVGYTYINTPN